MVLSLALALVQESKAKGEFECPPWDAHFDQQANQPTNEPYDQKKEGKEWGIDLFFMDRK